MSEFRVWTSFRLGRLALISGHYADNEAFMSGRNMAARTEYFEREKRALPVRFATFCEEMNAREAPSMEPKKPLSVTNAKRRSHIIPNSLSSGKEFGAHGSVLEAFGSCGGAIRATFVYATFQSLSFVVLFSEFFPSLSP